MNRQVFFWLIAILLLAWVLRTYRISDISLRADEATNLYIAADSPAQIIRVFISDDPHMPLYYLILHYWMKIAGRSEISVRFPALFAGVTAVALVYVLGKQLFARTPGIALIGAFLSAINPYLVWDAQEVYMYSALTAVAIASFILFLRVMKPGARLGAWAIYVILNATGLFLHYLAILFIIAQGVLWLKWSVQRKLMRNTSITWFVAQGITLMLLMPWFILSSSASGFQSGFWQHIGLPEMVWRLVVAFSVGRMDARLMPPMVEPVAGSLLAIVFLALLLIGLFTPSSKDDAPARITLAAFLGVPVLVLFVHAIVRFPILDERYTLFLIPAFVLLVARGLDRLDALVQTRRVFHAATIVIVLASAYSLNNYFHVPAFSKSPDWRSFMRQLTASARPGDVLIQNYPDPALPYYLRERMPRVLLPRTGFSNAYNEVAADLDRLTTKYDRLWVQPVPFAEWDTNGLVVTWLDRHAYLAAIYEFHGLKLALYLSPHTALRQATPSHAIFDGSIRLLGYQVERPEKIQPETMAHVALYWQAQSPPTRALTAFLHLYSTDGKLWSQHDAPPLRGTYPTANWSPGEIIVDQFDMEIPADMPVGTYSLFIGMYDSLTQERVTIVDDSKSPVSDRRLFLMNIMVDRTIR